MYFRKDGNVFRPVSCKRLEAIRDGVKDWMYLSTLFQLMEQVDGKVPEEILKQCRMDIERFVKPGQKTLNECSSGKELLAGYIMKFDELLNPYNQE
jgi:hypothetical protein